MEKKKQTSMKIKLSLSAFIFVIMFFLEIFVMVNFSKNYIAMLGIAIVILASLFVVLNEIMKIIGENNEKREKQYEHLMNSDKAFYLIQKKNFSELDEKIDGIQKIAMIPVQEIISAQKGVAKVILKKDKESADAIMGSNVEMMELLQEMKEELHSSNSEVTDNGNTLNNEELQQIIAKQQEMLASMKDMEMRLSRSITDGQKSMAADQQMPQTPMEEETNATEVPSAEVSPIDEEPIISEITTIDEELAETDKATSESAPIVEEPSGTESAPITEELTDKATSESAPTMEQPAAPVAEQQAAAETTPAMEEPPIIEEIEIPEEKPVPPLPDLSDPNKKMSDDEIEALIASMS